MDIKDRFKQNLIQWEEAFSSKQFKEADTIIKELLIDAMVLHHNEETEYVNKIKDLSVEERHFMIKQMIEFLKRENTNMERRKLEKETPTVEKFKKFIDFLNIYNAVEEIVTLIFEVGKDFPEKLLWDLSYLQSDKISLEKYLNFKFKSEDISNQLIKSSIDEMKTNYVEIIPPDDWYCFAEECVG